jgi:hypothetical protein
MQRATDSGFPKRQLRLIHGDSKIVFQFVCPFSCVKPLSPVKAVNNAAYLKGGTTMKSLIRTLVLPGVAAASKRPMTTTEPNRNQLRFRFKTPHLLLLLGLIAPLQSFAAEQPYCIAAQGGFGAPAFGTTFVARSFSLPAASKCTTWSGYTKTATTVVLITGGTACLSTDSTALTVSVSSADPSYGPAVDYIQMYRTDATQPFSGQDYGTFAGTAEPAACTSDLLNLPAYHD